MNPTRRILAVLGAVAALATAASAHAAATTYITIGERAYALLKPLAPRMETLSSVNVAVTVPEARGSRRLKRSSEAVYAVALDSAVLPDLAEAVHTKLQRCGGFMQHDTMAEALTVLHRAGQGAPDPGRAPSYVLDNPNTVAKLINDTQASNILSTIQSLSDFQNRRYNSTHGAAASNWLFNHWKTLAAGNRAGRVQVRQYTHSWGQKSVILDILGSERPDEVIVMGAHLDSISSGAVETARAPGADDDASGVASLTEAMRVLLHSNFVGKRTVRFIAYAAEEAGLLGSRDIAVAAVSAGTNVMGVLQLDMTAYQGDATDLWLYTDYTNAAQNQFLADLAGAYLPELTVGYDACGYGCSDHASWHTRGFIASFPFEASDAHYNMRIHTPNDTIANFGGTANHAVKFAKLALVYAIELGMD